MNRAIDETMDDKIVGHMDRWNDKPIERTIHRPQAAKQPEMQTPMDK